LSIPVADAAALAVYCWLRPIRAERRLRLELSGGKHNNTAQKLYETNGWLRDNEYYH